MERKWKSILKKTWALEEIKFYSSPSQIVILLSEVNNAFINFELAYSALLVRGSMGRDFI